jgi:FtsP/CotA-like multicopper oxidase with cupredoxin domain
VKEETITVNGREARIMAIRQTNGALGFSPQKDGGFHVEVANALPVPTCIHWHGLVLPNLMDGVPFVTQAPIPPGGTHVYNFPLLQQGTYWMHSHYGLQEQLLNAAPLVIWTPAEKALADVQHVVMVSDFSFTPPGEILAQLKKGMPMKSGMMNRMGAAPKAKLYAQKWDAAAHRFERAEVEAALPDIDVHYDALLANYRTIEQPEMLAVKGGQTVVLRIVAASSATDFYVDTGALDAELLAVDGQPVQPIRGNYFQLAIAQRLDLRVKIPAHGGSFPILFQGEGTRQLAGVVLATEGAKAPELPKQAALAAAGLDNGQEKQLRAARPLADRSVDRTLPAVLGGSMHGYVWTINGGAYPNRDSLDVKRGERVEIVLTNKTSMGHPMHLHGHDFQVVEIDGQKLAGPVRDTVEVPPGSTMKIVFDANNPGVWAFHCHILYHMATGMFTVVKYEGADTEFWQPDKVFQELVDGIPPR